MFSNVHVYVVDHLVYTILDKTVSKWQNVPGHNVVADSSRIYMNCFLRGFISAKQMIVALESIAPVNSHSIVIRSNACLDRRSFKRLCGSQG